MIIEQRYSEVKTQDSETQRKERCCDISSQLSNS